MLQLWVSERYIPLQVILSVGDDDVLHYKLNRVPEKLPPLYLSAAMEEKREEMRSQSLKKNTAQFCHKPPSTHWGECVGLLEQLL